MTDDSRPPVAIRSLRPYSTVEAFLAEERDTLTRTAITLIGAPSRPRGVIIRFELTLSDGTPLVRGEGRVLGFQPPDEHGPCSLTLRFTRLDAKSKGLVDRAAELREASAGRPSEAMTVGSDTEPPAASASDRDPTTAVPPPPVGSPTMKPHPFAPAEAVDAHGLTTELRVTPLTEPPPPSEEIAVSVSSGNLPMMDAEEIGAATSSPTEAPPAFAHATRSDDAPTEFPPAFTSGARSDDAPTEFPPAFMGTERSEDAPTEYPPPVSGRSPGAENRETQLERLRVRAKTLSAAQVATILARRTS